MDASKLYLDEHTEVEVFFPECIGHRMDRTLPPVRRWHDSIVLEKDIDYIQWLHSFLGRDRHMFQREATRAVKAEE